MNKKLLLGLILCGIASQTFADNEEFIDAAKTGDYKKLQEVWNNKASFIALRDQQDDETEEGVTALWHAAGGMTDAFLNIVEFLLSKPGIDLTVANPQTGMTLLMRAANGGSLEIVNALLEAGVDINVQNAKDGNKTALDYAKSQQKKDAIKPKKSPQQGQDLSGLSSVLGQLNTTLVELNKELLTINK